MQVFINLISNARKYCDAAYPELRIVVRQRAGRVTVDIIDNGSGIPPEFRLHVFEKFFRVPQQSRGTGTGLGLAIVHEIVTAHGG